MRAPLRAGRAAGAGGFTLIEVLVATGMVAMALIAGLSATMSLTRHTERQSDMLLAQLCAENALVRLRLARQMPGIGESTVNCEQAGRSYQVALAVSATPNPDFRQVQAQVRRDASVLLQLGTVIGRY